MQRAALYIQHYSPQSALAITPRTDSHPESAENEIIAEIAQLHIAREKKPSCSSSLQPFRMSYR